MVVPSVEKRLCDSRKQKVKGIRRRRYKQKGLVLSETFESRTGVYLLIHLENSCPQKEGGRVVQTAGSPLFPRRHLLATSLQGQREQRWRGAEVAACRALYSQ